MKYLETNSKLMFILQSRCIQHKHIPVQAIKFSQFWVMIAHKYVYNLLKRKEYSTVQNSTDIYKIYFDLNYF